MKSHKREREENWKENEYLTERKMFWKRLCIVWGTLGALFVVWLLFAVKNIQLEMDTPKQQAAEAGLQNLYVTHITTGSSKRVAEEKIQWWYNEEDQKYYLLLPSSANLNSLKLGLEGLDAIYLDGMKIHNAKKFQTTIGEHTVTTEINDKSYELIIMKSSNLATIFIETESGSMDYIDEEKGNQESGSILITTESGDTTYLGALEYIRGRGNMTWDADKKGYHIKLPKKQDLFGMGKAKDWILLANNFDASMLRNTTTYDFAKASGVAFTPDSKYIDLYINTTYWGTYQLCEKVEVNENRVDIPNLGKETENVNPGLNLAECEHFGDENVQGTVTVPETSMGYVIPENPIDITGGYLLELEIGGRYVHEKTGFVTTRNRSVVIQSPKYASEEQTAYISDLYQEFEDSVFEFDGVNPNTGKAYYEYIDLDSFAKKYLVEEITKNLDAMITSQYLYKYPDKISNKLYAGPAWDYDNAIGNEKAEDTVYLEDGTVDLGADTTSPEGLYAMRNKSDAPIWYALYYRPEFQEAFKQNYKNIFRENVLNEVNNHMDKNAALLTDSSIMNSIRWKKGTYANQKEIETSYLKSVAEVKKFLKDRIVSLDNEWQVSK